MKEGARTDHEKPNPLDRDKIECAACHQRVPSLQIVRIGGRELCRACAALWFDEDES